VPTYEYACRDCGQHVEVVQSFKDAALTECGTCGGRLRKVYSAAGIIFKGSGYYVNDSRKAAASQDGSSPSDAATGDGTSRKAGDGGAEKKKEAAGGESKPAATSGSSGGESAA